MAKLRAGGVLQLATYSTLGMASWRRGAAQLIHHLAPELVDSSGGLRRQPTPSELRALRHSIFCADSEEYFRKHGIPLETRAAREHLLHCEEFYSATGCHDLLFHPSERTFTLLEVKAMLADAGCAPIGVFFASLDVDAAARQAKFARDYLTC